MGFMLLSEILGVQRWQTFVLGSQERPHQRPSMQGTSCWPPPLSMAHPMHLTRLYTQVRPSTAYLLTDGGA